MSWPVHVCPVVSPLTSYVSCIDRWILYQQHHQESPFWNIIDLQYFGDILRSISQQVYDTFILRAWADQDNHKQNSVPIKQ